MKKLIFSGIFSLLFFSGYAQLEFGPRVGLGTAFTDVSSTSDDIASGDAEFGLSLGVFGRVSLGSVSIMPEVLYSTTNTHIVFNRPNLPDQIVETELNQIDVPVNVQLTDILGILHIQGGLVGSYLIEADGGPQEIIDNYEDFTLGFQTGVGVSFGNILLDLKYESNLGDISNGSQLGGFEYDQRQSSVKLSMGIDLF